MRGKGQGQGLECPGEGDVAVEAFVSVHVKFAASVELEGDGLIDAESDSGFQGDAVAAREFDFV